MIQTDCKIIAVAAERPADSFRIFPGKTGSLELSVIC